MNNNGQNLTKKQFKVIAKVLESRSIVEGVENAKISRTTFYEWLKVPEFKAELERQQKEIVTLALHDLKSCTSEAVSVLRALLTADSERIRLSAASTIIDQMSKFVEYEDLAKRLEKLEEQKK